MFIARRAALLAAILGAWLMAHLPANGQSQPGPNLVVKEKKPKPPPDEFKAILSAIEEAYKAPREVDKDVLDELRKQYRNPTPERETKIFKEIRRLYATTPELEEAILGEIRRAYAQPSAEQEERIFHTIRRAGQLPLGTVPGSIQTELAAKLFGRLDRDGNGVLDENEMSDNLLSQRQGWDRNRDGAISFAEYEVYYQANLKSVSEQVAAGAIPLKVPKSESVPEIEPEPVIDENPRRVEIRAGKAAAVDLPDWFAQFDLNADGQVGLYEWKQMRRPIADFLAMDRNADGFVEAAELRLFLTEQSQSRQGSSSR